MELREGIVVLATRVQMRLDIVTAAQQLVRDRKPGETRQPILEFVNKKIQLAKLPQGLFNLMVAECPSLKG